MLKTTAAPTPQYHVMETHMVLAARMKQKLVLDSGFYRRNLLGSTFMYDTQRFKEVHICRACSTTLFSIDACRQHAANMHSETSFW